MAHPNSAPTPLSATLPTALTTFVGREREVVAVSDLLSSARLVTLTGAGGSGKTRLAAEVVRGVSGRFADGVAWIELAAIADPGLILGHIAASLGVNGTGLPQREALRGALHDREILLALDNCEHVIGACAQVAELILRDCPRLRILATSREALGVAGERAWLVPVLSLPTTDDSLDVVSESEAVRLFVDRARAASAAFVLTEANSAVVARLCLRLDGLPLAIELAAARVRVLSPDQIVSRLDTGFNVLATSRRASAPRHRTLRDAIDWSYELLDERERLALRRLSVFAGEFTIDAAEVVCVGDAVARDDVLELVTALVDKSLVVVRDHVDEARYHLLETIRQYSRERLDESTDGATAGVRHADFYSELIRVAEPHFITPNRPAWVNRVQRELDDVRLALGWTAEHDRPRHVDLSGKLGWFWYSSGLWTEGRRWLDQALALPEAHGRDERRARVLLAAGVIAALQGQGGVARDWLEESSDIGREVGNHGLAAYSDSYIGIALGQEGLPAAEAPTRAALAWFEQSGDRYGQRLALVVLATLLLKEGKLTAARAVADDAVRIARAFGLGRELGIALQVLGTVQLHQGELDSAARAIADALRALRRDPQAFWLARATELMAVLECLRGQPVHAARLFGAAEARRERMGAVLFQLDRERLAPHIAAARAAAGDGPFMEAWLAGRALPFEEAIDVAIDGAVLTGAAPPAAPIDSGAMPESSSTLVLHVRALGPLEIVRDGVPVPHSAWKYARPRELFVYLLAHREGRTREQVGLAFWPDASAAQVKNNFHVMLHHLRRALGRADLVVFEDDRYRVNWELGVELDALAFERDAVAARRALRSSPRSAEAAQRLHTVLKGYRGGFLEDENAGDWHLEMRERLDRVRVDGLITLGAYFADIESWAEAANVYRDVVSADELNEDAHRQLMASLARAGQRGEALRHYDRFAAVLRKDLGAAPEGQTVALYDRLRKAESV